MRILIVDDEKTARDDLERVIKNAVKEPEIYKAETADETVTLCRQHMFDTVFLDIQMPDRDGLEIAREILDIHPHTNIVVQTANPQYALDAYELYVCDFILKPVSENDIRAAIEHLRWPVDAEVQKIRLQCFGNFEVFWNDEPIAFKRKKTKELLAYLVDRNGTFCSSDEIAAVLWEEISDISSTKAYIRSLITDLKRTFNTIGMENAVVRKHNEVAIRRDMFDCDYFSYLDGEIEAKTAFLGEYMMQYSWAEQTTGMLEWV